MTDAGNGALVPVPLARGRHGAVVAPHYLATAAGLHVLIWDAAERRQVALNGSGRAPAGVDAANLRRRGLERIPLRGALAVTIPGAVRSWGDAHRRYGRVGR